MSAALEILGELERLGISVRAEGDALKLRPADALEKDLLERVRQHKPEILEALRPRPIAELKPETQNPCRYDWQHGYRWERLHCVVHDHNSRSTTVFRFVSSDHDVLLEMAEKGYLIGQALDDSKQVQAPAGREASPPRSEPSDWHPAQQIEGACWHCQAGRCACITCSSGLTVDEIRAGRGGTCVVCGGTGRSRTWIQ